VAEWLSKSAGQEWSGNHGVDITISEVVARGTNSALISQDGVAVSRVAISMESRETSGMNIKYKGNHQEDAKQ
jgi:hypothetical protein